MVRPTRFYLKLAAAWVRGRAAQGMALDVVPELLTLPLDRLDAQQLAALVAGGEAAGMAMANLTAETEPLVVLRVQQWLRRMGPTSLLDVGSGPLLLPILDAFPHLPATAMPLRDDDTGLLEALVLGGWQGLTPISAESASLGPHAFDVVLALDGLAGLAQVEETVLDLTGWARRAVFLAAPNREGDWAEPRAVELFGRSGLTALLTAAGAREVTIDLVGDHLLAVAQLP